MKMNEQNKGIETKTKTRNHVLLLTKVLSEAIMDKLKLRSKQNKAKQTAIQRNSLVFIQAKNYCINLK